jgi:hypothetical protein
LTLKYDDVVTERPMSGAVEPSAESEGPLPLPPLTINALMVTKADLVQALRVYLPNIADIEAIDGDRFLLSVSGDTIPNGGV